MRPAPRLRSWIGISGALMLLAACGSGSGSAEPTSFVADIRGAVGAVEAELGPGQEFFEVTSGPQLTNVFVAIDDATAAVPYVYIDGELQPPAPALTGASGFVFTADAIDFDESTVLGKIDGELPDAVIDTFSVEGAEGGGVRYVASVRSSAGGVLDVTLGPDGAVLAVDPA